MGIETMIGAGASLLGSAMQADAAGDAVGMQAGATAAANARLDRQYDQTRSDLAPYREYGGRTVNRLEYLLGLRDPYSGVASESRQTIRGRLAPNFSKQVANDDEFMSYYFPTKTVTDEDALTGAVDAEIQRQAQAAANAPKPNDPAFGSLLRDFTGEDLQNEPGYQFGLREGQTALDRAAARGGTMFSGAALKAAQRYGQDFAGTKYGEAFNRDSANKTRAYNFLSGGVSLGQNAAAQTGNAGMNMAQQVGANTTGLGDSMGAVGIASARAIGGGLAGAAGAYQQEGLINGIREQNGLLRRITGGNSSWNGTGLGNFYYGNGTSGD